MLHSKLLPFVSSFALRFSAIMIVQYGELWPIWAIDYVEIKPDFITEFCKALDALELADTIV